MTFSASVSAQSLVVLWVFATLWAILCSGIYRGALRLESWGREGEPSCGCCVGALWIGLLFAFVTYWAFWPICAVVVVIFAGAWLHRQLVSRSATFGESLVFFTIYLFLVLVVAVPFIIGFVLFSSRLPASTTHNLDLFYAGFFVLSPVFAPIAVAIARRVRASMRAFK